MQAASGRDDQIQDLPKFSFFLSQKEARQDLEEITPRPRHTHTHETAISHTAVFAEVRQGEAAATKLWLQK